MVRTVAEFSSDAAMRREIGDILASARWGEFEPAVFGARLEEVHARFLGDQAGAPDIVEQRHLAEKAYVQLLTGTEERHHYLELMADALGVDPPTIV
jgi:hypothetical protein